MNTSEVLLKKTPAIIVLFVLSSAAAALDPSRVDNVGIDDQKQIITGRFDDLRHELNIEGALIRSERDLLDHLGTFKEGDSPFDYLSPRVKSKFIDSLQFGSKGLASLNFQLLEDELSSFEIYAILELFGWQELYFHILNAEYASKADQTINGHDLCISPDGDNTCADSWVKGHCTGWKACGGPLSGWCRPSNCNN